MTLNKPVNGAQYHQAGFQRDKLTSLLIAITFFSSLLLVYSYQAYASLGDDAASVVSDANVLGATPPSAALNAAQVSGASQSAVQSYILHTSAGERYTYSEFVTAGSLQVREFVTPDGKVFGIAWQGSRAPDLQVLLGSYFPGWHDSVASQPHQPLHHSNIQSSSLVVQIASVMGHVAGRAWAPKLVPAGVDARNVVK